jgi:hypothetical protein
MRSRGRVAEHLGDKRTGYGASQGFTTGTPALS